MFLEEIQQHENREKTNDQENQKQTESEKIPTIKIDTFEEKKRK